MGENKGNGFVFITQIGVQLVVTTFVCAGIGYFFDSRLNMRFFPGLSIIGLLIGGGAGFWMVFRTVTRMTDPVPPDKSPKNRE